MLKFITFSFIIFFTLGYSQTNNLPQLNFDNYSFPKAIVIDVENKNQNELKKNIQNWIDGYYSKSSLIESDFSENTFFITAKSDNLFKVKNLTSNLKYQLKISLRDQKYRFELTTLKYRYYTEYREVSSVNLIKDEVIRRDLDQSRSLFSSFFSNLNSDLFEAISGSDSDW